MSKRVQRPLSKTVKETVDYVFSYLHPFPDGVVFSAKELGFNEKRVLKILTARGIIAREQVKGVYGKQFRYKWSAAMPPTNVLYGSIADEIRDLDSVRTKNDAAVCVEYDDGNDVLRRKNSEARAADCHRDDNNHDNKGYPACRNL